MDDQYVNSQAEINRQYSRCGLSFSRCRYLRGDGRSTIPRLIYSAVPTDEFWAHWRVNPDTLRHAGYRPTKTTSWRRWHETGTQWVVEIEHPVPPGYLVCETWDGWVGLRLPTDAERDLLDGVRQVADSSVSDRPNE